MGVQWSFYDGAEGDTARYRIEGGDLVLRGKGTSPADASPLWFVTGDHAYEVEVEVETSGKAMAGLLVFGVADEWSGFRILLYRSALHDRDRAPRSSRIFAPARAARPA